MRRNRLLRCSLFCIWDDILPWFQPGHLHGISNDRADTTLVEFSKTGGRRVEVRWPRLNHGNDDAFRNAVSNQGRDILICQRLGLLCQSYRNQEQSKGGEDANSFSFPHLRTPFLASRVWRKASRNGVERSEECAPCKIFAIPRRLEATACEPVKSIRLWESAKIWQ